MNLICFIPSKGRPQTKTYKLFEAVGITVMHFIEPQDFDAYNVPNKVSILQNDKGIGYVRNFMLQYAKDNNHDWIIMCDDDVASFGIYDGKTKKTDAAIWLTIFDKAQKLPFEIIGINYTQHAWHEAKPYSVNKKFAEVCILLNIKKIHWRYRPEFDLKEDRDFALQAIKNGTGILRFNHYWFSCPNVGSNSGGLQDMYKAKRDELSAQKMVIEWSPFASMVDKKGRADVKIDIKGIANHYKKEVK
jgi:glycosyltransferase involved in cell wall biosynthesis